MNLGGQRMRVEVAADSRWYKNEQLLPRLNIVLLWMSSKSSQTILTILKQQTKLNQKSDGSRVTFTTHSNYKANICEQSKNIKNISKALVAPCGNVHTFINQKNANYKCMFDSKQTRKRHHNSKDYTMILDGQRMWV